jgi:hypothetical protein
MNINSRKFTEPHRHANEYLAMKKVLEENGGQPFRLYDCLYEQYGEHPVTFGQSLDGQPTETVLTDSAMQRVNASLDYVFQLTLLPGNAEEQPVSAVSNIRVERFLVDPAANEPEDCDETKQPTMESKEAVGKSIDTLNSASSGSLHIEYPAEVMIEMKTLVNGVWENSGQNTSEERILNEMEMGVTTTTNTVVAAEQKRQTGSSAIKSKLEEKMGKVLAFLGKQGSGSESVTLSQLSSHYGISCTLS